MKEDFFKMSIIDGCLNICKHRSIYSDCSIEDAVKHLKEGPTHMVPYDYKKSMEVGNLFGWEIIVITGDRRTQLQQTLKNLVMKIMPFWAKVAYLGRSKVLKLLSDDQVQCLTYAGLLNEELSEEALEWWEDIASISRQIDQQKKLEIGRNGERRSLQLEKKKLDEENIDRIPKWISLEDNTAGYDILSYKRGDRNEIREKYIEVKACNFSPTHFFITNNEWEKAVNNKEKYLFHVWNFERDTLIELSVEQVEQHIPTERGNGRWKLIEVFID
ncbi:hypothetical protein QFZ81_000090 [Paenibacillus sp. V4I9]|uniref:DUF3883 domain-containing protein n=1 Tax=Paenibacillus sp. V4I9 TaxID=3042308 RepID=UPI002785350F|nr:DUF3883 domain-containing protein [Paenibacillus sp. V4I9]MDQ0885002.1 hypothetical protein [Paenibacillus sp. V4I9]